MIVIRVIGWGLGCLLDLVCNLFLGVVAAIFLGSFYVLAFLMTALVWCFMVGILEVITGIVLPQPSESLAVAIVLALLAGILYCIIGALVITKSSRESILAFVVRSASFNLLSGPPD